MTADKTVAIGSPEAPNHASDTKPDQAHAKRQSDSGDEVVLVDRPVIQPTKPFAFFLMVIAPFTAIFLFQRVLEYWFQGEPSVFPYLFLAYLLFSFRKEMREAKKARYIIKESGLEWIKPGLAGGMERVEAKWDDIIWIGPLAGDPEAVKGQVREYKLTTGRIRTIPATSTAVIEGALWRVIHRGQRLYHAVDFYPTPRYLEILKATAPACVFNGRLPEVSVIPGCDDARPQ